MAMFFDFPVNAPNEYTPILSKWHSRFSLLAVASKERHQGRVTGNVSLFNGDGEHLPEATLQRSAHPSFISWHPTQKILATGWSNGGVLLWNEESQNALECDKIHEGAITFVSWTVDGSRLLTGDEEGIVCCWRLSATGAPTMMSEIRLAGAATHCRAVVAGGGDASVFYVATSDHVVHRCDAAGGHSEAFTCENSVHELTYDPKSAFLIAIASDLMVTQHRVASNGALSEKYDFKLSGKSPGESCWLHNGILCATTAENQMRFWNPESSDMYSISLADHKGLFTTSDALVTVGYDERSHTLAAGSRNGFVFMWKLVEPSADSSESWSFMTPVELNGSLTHVSWGPNAMFVAQNTTDCVSILRKHVMRRAFSGNVAAIQVSSSRLIVDVKDVEEHALDCEFSIKGVTVSSEAVVAWGSKSISIYELVRNGEILRHTGTFACEASTCAIHSSTVFTASGSQIDARVFNGASKQLLSLGSKGNINQLKINGDFLVASTDQGVIRCWDLSRREARFIGNAVEIEELDSISDIAISCDGAHVAFFGHLDGSLQPSVWLLAIESDKMTHYGLSSEPQSLFWDSEDPRLLCVETLHSLADGKEDRKIVSLFAAPDQGLIHHHATDVENHLGPLIGVKIPFMIFATRNKTEDNSSVEFVSLHDFKGLENADRDARTAMMEFSYQLTLGNLDEAFKAVRVIQSDTVWTNMARMCVTTKRMDVATVCMGRMGNAIAARALRESSHEPNEIRAAILAMHLGMTDEAEKLFKAAGRFDYLNQLYRDSNRWADALRIASDHDRLHLKSTHYEHGTHYEALGKIPEAVKAFEKTESQKFEIPRILLDDQPALAAYVKASRSKDMLKWWAKYKESQADMEEAIAFYGAADDILSLVRVYCFCGEHERAYELVQKTQNRAAAYHLARHFETMQDIDRAIDLYSMSECYTNAIKLAKEHERRDQMLSLALNSSKVDMISAGEYYESQGIMDKAVMLYHKGGRVAKALQMCFENSLFSTLGSIAADLDDSTDPALLQKTADFFIEHSQFDRAVNILIVGKRFNDALKLIQRHNIHLTDENAERMTIAKGEGDKAERAAILERIGDICNSQGSYQVATRKYTQAGKMTKAMKSLLRSGDTDRIIYFANKCRQKEVYVLAANYLQSLDWRQDKEVMKHIVQFYTKGRALDSLATFYESCARAEIDEYQNYDKALGALNEALRYLGKARMKDLDEQEQRLSTLQAKIMLVEKFISIQALEETDPQRMLEEANSLLTGEPHLDDAIRVGDIYGMMIENLVASQQFERAYQLKEDMIRRVPGVNIALFVNLSSLEAIHSALGIPMGRSGAVAAGRQADDDEVEEDIQSENI